MGMGYKNYSFRVMVAMVFLLGAVNLFPMQLTTGSEGNINMLQKDLNFSWISLPDSDIPALGGMGRPTEASHIQTLEALGVGGLITLTQDPLSKELLTGSSIKNVHIPFASDQAPTVSQAKAFIGFLGEIHRNDKKVVVHCERGNSRVGTFLAFYLLTISHLISKVLSVQEAVDMVKANRPQASPPESLQIAFLEECFKIY